MTPNKVFYLRDGKKFSTVKALANELKNMSIEIYNHHVNPAKNDFSNWLKNSIKNEILAKRVDGHINKIEMELEILRHLIHSSNKKTKTTKKIIKTKAKIKDIKKKEVVRISTKKKSSIKKISTKSKIKK